MPDESLAVRQFAELLRGQEKMAAEVAALRRDLEAYRNEHRLEHKSDSEMSRRRWEEAQERADKRHDEFIDAFHEHELRDEGRFASIDGTVKARSQIGAIIGGIISAALAAVGYHQGVGR